MTSRTSFFNGTVCRKTAARFWPLWVGYFLVLMIALPLHLNQVCRENGVVLFDVQMSVYNSAASAVPVLTFLVSPLAAMAVFSHLYNERSCGVYASLPVRRETMFISVVLAAFLPLLLAQVAAFGLTAAVEASAGMLHWPSLLTWLGISVLDLLSFFGFAALCAQMTGTTLVVPAVYVVLQFTAYIIENLLNEFAQLFLYGYSGYTRFLQWLSPIVYRESSAGYYSYYAENGEKLGYYFEGWLPAALYAAFGVLCIVLALLMLRKRRMETAGDFVAAKPLKPAFRWCMAVGCALVFSYLMYLFFNSSNYFRSYRTTVLGLPLYPAMLLFLLLGGFIGWFGAEMLMQKSFRVFRGKILAGFLFFAVLAVGALSAVNFDWIGYDSRMPDPEKLIHAEVGTNGNWYSVTSPEEIRQITELHRSIAETKDANLRALQSDAGYHSQYITLFYTKRDGTIIRREYRLASTPENEPVFRQMEAFFNSPEQAEARLLDNNTVTAETSRGAAVTFWNMGDGALEFSPEEAWELFSECVLPDLREGKLGRVWLSDDSPAVQTYMSCEIRFSVAEPVDFVYPYPSAEGDHPSVTVEEWEDKYGKDGYYTRNVYVRPTTESTRTNDWLTGHGVTLTPEIA